MSVQIIDIQKECWPQCLLIGKRGNDWNAWWQGGWFAPLEAMPVLPENGDAFIGAVHIVNGAPERWIGMFFPMGTPVPEGYESITIPAKDYAVCYLRDREGSSDFFAYVTHEQCLSAIRERGYTRSEDDWCFERYACPRFTTPDDEGMVVLDYVITIQ